VPEDHYFILAEITEEEGDSRVFGWVHRTNLVGSVSAVWWPLKRLRRVKP
jgi:type IV secretory pathway protease TraF